MRSTTTLWTLVPVLLLLYIAFFIHNTHAAPVVGANTEASRSKDGILIHFLKRCGLLGMLGGGGGDGGMMPGLGMLGGAMPGTGLGMGADSLMGAPVGGGAAGTSANSGSNAADGSATAGGVGTTTPSPVDNSNALTNSMLGGAGGGAASLLSADTNADTAATNTPNNAGSATNKPALNTGASGTLTSPGKVSDVKAVQDGGLQQTSATTAGSSNEESTPARKRRRKRSPLMMGLGGMSGMPGLGGLGGGVGGMGGMGGMGGLGSLLGGGGMMPGLSARSTSSTPPSTAIPSSGCPPLYLIFARGTAEMQGTLGIVGRPLCQGLQASIPGTQCYDTVYSSDAEYMASPSTGANTASQYIASISARCPSTKFVLGGYSKGAMVVHGVRGKNVVGAVTFGDPMKAHPMQSTQNWKVFCNAGDPVCFNGMNPMAHMTYPMQDVGQAVQYLVQAYRGAGGATGSAATATTGSGTSSGASSGSAPGSLAGGLGGSGGLGGLGGLGSMAGMGGLGGLNGLVNGGSGGLSSFGLKRRSSTSHRLDHRHRLHRRQPQAP